MPQPSSPHRLRRRLWFITAAVVLLHGWVLAGWSTLINERPHASLNQTAAFQTRVVPIRPSPPAPSPPPRVIPTQTPPTKPPVERPPETSTAPDDLREVATSEPAFAEPIAQAPAPSPAASVPVATPGPSLTLQMPATTTLHYAVNGRARGFTYHATSELHWKHDNARYDAYFEVGAFLMGSRKRTSTGNITAQGLEPLRFSDKSRSEQAAHFEREQGKVIFSANTPEAPLQAGAQDQLSLFLQLTAMLAGDPQRYPLGTTISLPVVGPREADVWRFLIDSEETLQLPQGPVTALKMTRAPRKDYDQRVELWFAPSMAYLPVRIKITQTNGDFIDQQLN